MDGQSRNIDGTGIRARQVPHEKLEFNSVGVKSLSKSGMLMKCEGSHLLGIAQETDTCHLSQGTRSVWMDRSVVEQS